MQRKALRKSWNLSSNLPLPPCNNTNPSSHVLYLKYYQTQQHQLQNLSFTIHTKEYKIIFGHLVFNDCLLPNSWNDKLIPWPRTAMWLLIPIHYMLKCLLQYLVSFDKIYWNLGVAVLWYVQMSCNHPFYTKGNGGNILQLV